MRLYRRRGGYELVQAAPLTAVVDLYEEASEAPLCLRPFPPGAYVFIRLNMVMGDLLMRGLTAEAFEAQYEAVT